MFTEMFEFYIVRKEKKEMYVSPETLGAWKNRGWKEIKKVNLKKC